MTLAVETRAETPWHLWVVGALTLIWNAVGAYDYVMTQRLDMEYLQMAGMTPAQIDWLASFPWWAHTFWALGVWGALAGSVLLLARSRFAFKAYVISLIGIVPMTIFQFGSSHPGSLNGMVPAIFALVLIVATGVQAVYAWAMSQRGVLR